MRREQLRRERVRAHGRDPTENTDRQPATREVPPIDGKHKGQAQIDDVTLHFANRCRDAGAPESAQGHPGDERGDAGQEQHLQPRDPNRDQEDQSRDGETEEDQRLPTPRSSRKYEPLWVLATATVVEAKTNGRDVVTLRGETS